MALALVAGTGMTVWANSHEALSYQKASWDDTEKR